MAAAGAPCRPGTEADRLRAESTAREAAHAVFDAHAGPDGHVAAADLAKVLKALDFERRVISLGRGPVKQKLEVAATDSDCLLALTALGIGNAELRSGARVRWADFGPWYVAQVCGDAGHRRNKLLVKAIPGKSRASSYALPGALHTFGAPSLPNEVTLTQLLAHEFSSSSSSASRSAAPDVPVADRGARGRVFGGAAPAGAHERTHGSPSRRSESIATLITGGFSADPHTVARQGKLVATLTGEHAEYADVSKMVQVTGAAPGPPRDTRTSALRATFTAAAGASIGRGGAAGTTGASGGDSGAAVLRAGWKMEQFRNVAPRVPTDGFPLHHHAAC